MQTIITIGGGDMRNKTTLDIDRHIVSLTKKKKPTFLFIPTASSDAVGYYECMKEIYGTILGCQVDVLYLIRTRPTKEEIEKKIAAADIIYVGGGNTLMMMKLWRRLGIDRLLKEAWKKGTLMCGMSAGSICWFESGHSDSLSFYHPEKWKYINVKGLGILPGMHCPHYDSATLEIPRRAHFRTMMQKKGGTGIAIDDNCALVFHGTTIVQVLRSSKNANAYRVTKQRGIIREELI